MTTEAVKVSIIKDSVATDHPEPDMSILRQGRKKPPSFPIEIFGNELSSWLSNAAHGAGAPVDYVAGALLAAASALIGSSRRISPWERWEEPSALWIGLVGDPSSNKSPAIDPIINIIHSIERDMASNFEPQYRGWETKKELASCIYEQWKKDIVKAKKDNSTIPIKPEAANVPEEITRPRILGNDASIEKLGMLLSTHPKGLLFYRDELTGWFGSFDKYSGQDSDKAFWLESYGGRNYIIDRVKHSKPIIIPHLLVSIMGGVQPDKLAKLIKGADDGFTARFLWLWAEPIEPFRPERVTSNAMVLNILRKLSKLTLCKRDKDGETDRDTNANTNTNANTDKDDFIPKILRLSEEATCIFQEWRKEHHVSGQSTYGLLKSSYGKAPGHLLRLALTIELLWWAADSTTNQQMTNQSYHSEPEPASISTRAIRAAISLIEGYFKPMAERVFGDIAVPEEEQLAATLARYILKTKPRMINLRHIGRVVCLTGFRDQNNARAAAQILVERDWLLDASKTTPLGGRPRTDYAVNPKLWGMVE